MDCPRCKFSNRGGAKFCIRCGEKFELACPQCGMVLPPGAQYCDGCGSRLKPQVEIEQPEPTVKGERKQVTVLFSDLSGYTSISEILDPEDVRDIMSRIFGEIARVITKYEGFIEKFYGDEVMALFGIPKAHEDDPVRAIRAAKEIHDLVESMSPKLRNKTKRPLTMHSGVNTGLVLTSLLDSAKGTHEIMGDTVNLASRLKDLAKAGEILVGLYTFHQAEGYFNFETLESTKVKGKAEPIPVYRVLSIKEKPVTIHRVSGLKGDLIDRKVELAELEDSVKRLQQGKGTIYAIYGEAGTGKSRLVEEFKAKLNLEKIQWQEGHAHAYSQNIPYYPLMDLLNRAWQIEEADSPEIVREKIELGIERITGKKSDIAPYIGGLYSLSYPEIKDVSPEFWKSRLIHAVQVILEGLIQRGPAIILLEDLHWADPSSVDLLRLLLTKIRDPALFLCVYRTFFILLPPHQQSSVSIPYEEIQLRDLSPTEIQEMLESLLKTKDIPVELRKFVQRMAEGSPFYLEEIVNSLIQAGTLAIENGRWKLTRTISKSAIPATIQGVISARIDLLDHQTKRILQEASVIGKTFHYDILKRITNFKDPLEFCLHVLEDLDLIRTKSIEPDLEYAFKHTIIQEVAYGGLLKKERQVLHEKIGLVMERLFRDRLPEFYETIAFHFKQGESVHQAVNYLVKSGEKSVNRYSVEESHQYYKEAFEILFRKPDKTKEEKKLLIDILLQWASVFHYRGDFKELTNLLMTHQDLAESVEDKARLEMLLGFSLGFGNERFKESYQYLSNALEMGEKMNNQQIIGYACSWLSMTCAEMGLLDQAVLLGERAQGISNLFPSDHYLHFHSLSGMGQAYWHRGEINNLLGVGKALLDFGQKYSDIRSLVRGHYFIGWSHFIGGNLVSAVESFQRAIQISVDPYHSQLPRLGLVYSYVASNQFEKAEEPLQELLDFTDKLGVDMLGTPARALLGLISIARGDLGPGIKKFQESQRTWLGKERKCLYAASEYMMAHVYLKMSQGQSKIRLPMIIKNIGFLLRNLPFASKRAEEHFMKSIHVAKTIQAKSTLGRAYLDLGLLYKAKGKKDQARECLSHAIRTFEQCQIETYLDRARDGLASLE